MKRLLFFTFIIVSTTSLNTKNYKNLDIEKLYLLSRYSECVKQRAVLAKQNYIKAICYKNLEKNKKYLEILAKIANSKRANKRLRDLATLGMLLEQSRIKNKTPQKGLKLLRKINNYLYIEWIINKWI